jgi:hypothetical protein
MKNAMRTWIVGIGALLLAGALTGCGSSPVQTVAKSAPAAYPAPDVQIVAQPVLASYNQRALSRSADGYAFGSDESYSSRRRHHKHSHHKKAAQDTPADSDMGYMAADDPKLLQAEIAAKESPKEESKDWTAPGGKAPEGR